MLANNDDSYIIIRIYMFLYIEGAIDPIVSAKFLIPISSVGDSFVRAELLIISLLPTLINLFVVYWRKFWVSFPWNTSKS